MHGLPTFIFLKFSRALSICGVSIQPVSVQEPLLLSAQLCSIRLSTSGDLPSTNFCGSILPPPPLKCYKKQSFLTYSLICPGLKESHMVSPASRTMTAVICMLKYETADHYHYFRHKTDRSQNKKGAIGHPSAICIVWKPQCWNMSGIPWQ